MKIKKKKEHFIHTKWFMLVHAPWPSSWVNLTHCAHGAGLVMQCYLCYVLHFILPLTLFLRSLNPVSKEDENGKQPYMSLPLSLSQRSADLKP